MRYGAWESASPFGDLKGKTLVSVDGMEVGSGSVTFVCADGTEYTMEHVQDCCESVAIDDVVGNVADLIGAPLLMADEVEGDMGPPNGYESWTWTFYKLATVNGYVDVKWLGTSNGYYSESVSFWQSSGVVPPKEPTP